MESLAANRGKTLYCAVDQSDTFTKAETWAAGKDRNERDDTVYYGENGRFRGFLSAQEGYLTDGESGVTGISRERIFEFPEEERCRRWKTVTVTERLRIPEQGETLLAASPVRDAASNRLSEAAAKTAAQRRINGHNGIPRSAICGPTTNGAGLYPPENGMGSARCRDSDFDDWAQTQAEAECVSRGYEGAANTQDDPASEVWAYGPNKATLTGTFDFDTWRSLTYETTCERKVRKRVRR